MKKVSITAAWPLQAAMLILAALGCALFVLSTWPADKAKTNLRLTSHEQT